MTDIGNAVALLCSPDAGWITGQLIHADGGASLADTLTGAGGNDEFVGNGGDDILNGDGGNDQATYAGDLADYAVVYDYDGDGNIVGFLSVTDNNAGDGDEGHDTLSSIETVSFGEERPVAQGSDESAWSQNRRDEFEITAGGGGRLTPPRR